MSARDVADRFRRQEYKPSDLNSVTKALESRDEGYLRDVIASYIKYADHVDVPALVRYLKVAQDFWAAQEVISGLSNLKCRDSEFASEVLRYAKGVSWDPEGYAQIAAITAIPRILSGDSRVREILSAATRSDNAVVREIALEAVQAFLGIPASSIKKGLGSQELMQQLPREVQEWVNYRR